MPAHVGATALALIGLFNIAGTIACGYLGGPRKQKNAALGAILAARTRDRRIRGAAGERATVYLFAATRGLLWLGTVRLTSGIAAQVFGVKYLSMLFGIVFLFHQVGAFFGAWPGGWLFDATGSYETVWMIAIALSGAAALLNWPTSGRSLSEREPWPHEDGAHHSRRHCTPCADLLGLSHAGGSGGLGERRIFVLVKSGLRAWD